MINFASEIKQRVSMFDVCERYGIEVHRAGFAKCVFHAGDNTASMKIYPQDRGYNCFGCGEHGDCIDFVQKYFNLSFPAALEKLNSDMALGLPINSNPDDERRRYSLNIAAWKRKQEAEAYQQRLQRAQTAYDLAYNLYAYLDHKRLTNAPTSPDEPISDEYADAVKRLPIAKYQLDCAEMELVKIERSR